jgi:hypothetical protein
MYIENNKKGLHTKYRTAILKALKNNFDDEKLKITQFVVLTEKFLGGVLVYVEYTTKNESKNDSFSYALIRRDIIELYDDGTEALINLKRRMERIQTFWGRFAEFTVNEMIGAVLGLIMGVAFTGKFLMGADIGKEYIGIFSLVIGYYFAKKNL